MKSRKEIEAQLTAEIDRLAGERRTGESVEAFEARVARRAELAAKRQDLLPKKMLFIQGIHQAVARARKELQYKRTGPPEKGN